MPDKSSYIPKLQIRIALGYSAIKFPASAV